MRFTLIGVFSTTLAGITLLVATLFLAFLESSRRSILESAQLERASAALRVEANVRAELSRVERAAGNVELAIHYGTADVASSETLEDALFTELLEEPDLVDIGFARAEGSAPIPGPGGVKSARELWQIVVFRASLEPGSPIFTQRILIEQGRLVRELRTRPPGGPVQSGVFRILATGPSSVAYPPRPIAPGSPGGVRLGDLAYARADLPGESSSRGVVLEGERAVDDATGALQGLVTVSLSARSLDAIASARVNPRDEADPHRVFLCDTIGRLLTRLSPPDAFIDAGGVLRVAPASLPAAVGVALRSPLLGTLDMSHRERSERLTSDGQSYLLTLHLLRRPTGWVVGIVVPEDYYVHELEKLRDRFLVAYGAITLLAVMGGLLSLRAIRRGLTMVLQVTARMRRFDFAPSGSETAFVDVHEVLESLERAKTVVRTMGRYVPLDIVRRLHEANREPVLGSEPREMTLMFSDIRGFTSVSERLRPEALAGVLGLYFEAMTSAIEPTGGTIDKFIGDSVMAIWNAPGDCVHHSAAECRAVLGCIEAAKQLYASAAWGEHEPLHTRFGIHTGRALVGNFGSPSRLSYTAMGDAVNLTARLESLCKQYGVAVLASEAVRRLARGQYVFRLVDKVVVLGKTRSVRVYELLGAVGTEIPRLGAARAYEAAFSLYLEREFSRARSLFAQNRDDPPSLVLAERCARYVKEPPPPDWNGVFHAEWK